MEKEKLIVFLNRIFIPSGFKRKGNNWVINGDEINKIINLQKSQYSNLFYINYGYIINSLPLEGFVNHVDNRLSSTDKREQQKITSLLDLDYQIDTTERFTELEKIIRSKIIQEMQNTSKEADILTVLNQRQFLYTIPPVVLKHFKINIDA
jgi:ferritin-like protein